MDKKKTIWKLPDSFDSDRAPELHYINQEWVIILNKDQGPLKRNNYDSNGFCFWIGIL